MCEAMLTQSKIIHLNKMHRFEDEVCVKSEKAFLPGLDPRITGTVASFIKAKNDMNLEIPCAQVTMRIQ